MISQQSESARARTKRTGTGTSETRKVSTKSTTSRSKGPSTFLSMILIVLVVIGISIQGAYAQKQKGCSADNPIGPSSAPSASSSFNMNFDNINSYSVAIIFVQTNCSELHTGDISPGMSQSVSVQEGQVFLARRYVEKIGIADVVSSIRVTSTSKTSSWLITASSSSSNSLLIIIGIVVGIVVLLAIVAVVIFFIWRAKRNNTRSYQPYSSESYSSTKITSPPAAKAKPYTPYQPQQFGQSLSRPQHPSLSRQNNKMASLDRSMNNTTGQAPTSIVNPNSALKKKKAVLNTTKAAKRASLKWWEAPGVKKQNAPPMPGNGGTGGVGKSSGGTLGYEGVRFNAGTMDNDGGGGGGGNWLNTVSRAATNTLAKAAINGAGAGSLNAFDYYDQTQPLHVENDQDYHQTQQTLDAMAVSAGARLRVIHAAKAGLEDELTLMPGDAVVLREAYGDGWCLAEVVKSKSGYGVSSIGTVGMIPVACLDVMQNDMGSAVGSSMTGGLEEDMMYDQGGRRKRVQSMLRPESIAMFSASGRDVNQYQNLPVYNNNRF